MKTKTYADRRGECYGYVAGSHNEFILKSLDEGGVVDPGNRDYNNLVVVLKGIVRAGYGEHETELPEGSMIFIPAHSEPVIEALSSSTIIIGTFEFPQDIHTRLMMQSILELKSMTPFRLAPVPVKPVLKKYLSLLVDYLQDGMQCSLLHELKEKEIFLIFMWYYSDEELVSLLHPAIVRSPDFRSLVMRHYDGSGNVADLVNAVGMSRTKFDRKFREEFGESPKRWMQDRMAANVKYFMTKPDATVKDVMIRYDFQSFTQFNRFCRKHFGASPSELMRKKED